MAFHQLLKKSQLPILIFSSIIMSTSLNAQCDCAYPILFVHGWTGDATSFDPLYTDPDFMSAWGGLSGEYEAVLNATTQTNAYGVDGIAQTTDDDVLVELSNSIGLSPGCLYAIDFDYFWNLDQNNPLFNMNNPPSGESDSNQSAIEKQGMAVGLAIKKILDINPSKKKVILAGHSMGGLAGREYLQRLEGGTKTWWVNPNDLTDGHKVAKLATLGTPHRGSNASLANLLSLFSFDETSEAVRDLRYNYGSDSAPFLYGGPEDDHVDITSFFNAFKNGDVDCDGDYDTNPIVSLNDAPATPWNGTTDNPNMPLPSNVKYAYYTSYSLFDISLFQFNGGDGVVADERQWIYSGGNGSTGDFQNANSIPAPNDGVDYRLSDRVHSANNVFHTDQTGDLDDVLRILDEADYPFFAYEIIADVDYAGFSQIRADFVPPDSEYTLNGNKNIDGDWYKVALNQTSPGLDIYITPNVDLAGRIDFYLNAPADYSNANAPIHSLSWTAASTQQVMNISGSCIPAGDYYLRITHEGLQTSSWRKPYKFKVSTQACDAPTNLMANVTALSATLSWDLVNCASGYILQYRELGVSTWDTILLTNNNYLITGLIPDTDYEFQVSADCGVPPNATSTALAFGTTDCPNVLYIPSDPIVGHVPTGIYKVGQEITSNGLISTTQAVTYLAGDNIKLLPGFKVENGVVFIADIQACVSNPLQPNTQYVKEMKTIDYSELFEEQELTGIQIRKIPHANGKIVIKHNIPKAKLRSLSLESLDQKLTKSLLKEKMYQQQEFVIDKNDLSPGKYLLRFNIDGQEKIMKIVKRPNEAVRSRN